jgi:predicted transcriptional regulator
MQDSHLQSKREIADRVGVQESTLERILSMLSSKGYLEIEEKNMDQLKGCIGCPMSGKCLTQITTGNTYFITERGEKLLSSFF